MSKFDDQLDIQTCRDQHVALTYLLDQFQSLPSFAEEREVVALLARLRSVLVGHLRLEDEHIYPRLMQSTDENVKATALHYKTQMGNLAQAFSQFYARWTRPGAIDSRRAGYAQEWQTFDAALRERMAAEDDDLYVVAQAELNLRA